MFEVLCRCFLTKSKNLLIFQQKKFSFFKLLNLFSFTWGNFTDVCTTQLQIECCPPLSPIQRIGFFINNLLTFFYFLSIIYLIKKYIHEKLFQKINSF